MKVVDNVFRGGRVRARSVRFCEKGIADSQKDTLVRCKEKRN